MLGPDEIDVEVEAAAITAYDLLARGVTPGGAFVGSVVAAGAAATDLVGRRVISGPCLACGECEACRRGRLAACPGARWLGRDVAGALAGRVIARRRWACPLDGPLAGAAPGPEAAALPREAALAYALYARAGLAPGEVAIWLGDGPVARFGLAVTAARGGHGLVLSAEERTLSPDPLVASIRGRVREAGLPAAAWKIFEVSARPGWRRRAFALAAASGGTCALAAGRIAGVDEDEPLSFAAVTDGEATVLAVAAPHPDLLPELAAMVLKGELDLAGAVRLAPSSALEGEIANLRRGAGADRVLVITMR